MPPYHGTGGTHLRCVRKRFCNYFKNAVSMNLFIRFPPVGENYATFLQSKLDNFTHFRDNHFDELHIFPP